MPCAGQNIQEDATITMSNNRSYSSIDRKNVSPFNQPEYLLLVANGHHSQHRDSNVMTEESAPSNNTEDAIPSVLNISYNSPTEILEKSPTQNMLALTPENDACVSIVPNSKDADSEDDTSGEYY